MSAEPEAAAATPARPDSPRPGRALGGRRGSAKGGRGFTGVRRKSSAVPLIIAAVVAVVLIIVIAVAASQGGSSRGSAGGSKQGETGDSSGPRANEADLALYDRSAEFLRTVKTQNLLEIEKFYSFAPSEQTAVRAGITALLESGIFKEASVKAARADTGVVTFALSGGQEKALAWKQVDGVWLIAEKP